MDLQERMQQYEDLGGTQNKLTPNLPIVIRLDGRNFSRYTQGMEAFHGPLIHVFDKTMEAVMEETHARIGYTASDEINLILDETKNGETRETIFGGRIMKICSVFASMTTAYFNYYASNYMRNYTSALGMFDARCFTVPTVEEATNYLIWREQNYQSNSISMAAREHFSHREVQGKNTAQLLEMMSNKGVNWDNFPARWKWGLYLMKQVFETHFTDDEIEKLPLSHAARKDPSLVIKRSRFVVTPKPPLAWFYNRVDYIFGEGANNE